MSPCTCVPHWGGHRAGHCTTCCQTFSSESGFNRHLITARGRFTGCRDPYSTIGRDGKPAFAWNDQRRMWQLAAPRPLPQLNHQLGGPQ
jgi:hypothetical protein